jgi:hypothetical protein
MPVFVRMHESEREKQKKAIECCVCVCMCVCLCLCAIDMSVSLYDRTTWALAVRLYVSALGRPSLNCVCVHPCVASFSVSVSVYVTDWVGGRTPACGTTALAPRGPSMWGPGWRSAPI